MTVDKPVDNLFKLSTEFLFVVDNFKIIKLSTCYPHAYPQQPVDNLNRSNIFLIFM